MFRSLLKALTNVTGDPNKKDVDRYAQVAERINGLESHYRQLSDTELRAKTDQFKAQLADTLRPLTDEKERRRAEQAKLEELLPEAFATVRETAMRVIGQRHYDVQLIGGQALHGGKIAEMRTGEGKTLVATLPTYLNALTGRGVHVVTVNDYLARRDARWMAPIYHALGMSVGVLQEAARTEHGKKAFMVDFDLPAVAEDAHYLRLVDRREAYAADITYGTNHEFGFDYLRDNMAMQLSDRVQRERYMALVDEVDNILIDEARTPLIISGPAGEEPTLYQRLAQVVRQLKPEHIELSEKDRNVALTELGEAVVERLLGTPMRDPERPEDVSPEQARLMGHLEQALRAEFLFRRNKDYLVEGNKIVIVDEFTGRKMEGRRWSDGLHQAVEAKEGVPIQAESVTYATVTLQNYFRLYQKLGGMSGTALTEAEEFDKIYKLGVLAIPMHLEYQATRPSSGLVELDFKEDGLRFSFFARKDDPEKKPVFWRRKDYPDVVFRTEEAKLRAITVQALQRHALGQPLLVGTTSVELSERVSERLRAAPLQLLTQILLIRDAWFEKNNKEEDGMMVAELQPLNADFHTLQRDAMAKQMRELGLSSNPAEEKNLERLSKILALPDQPELRARLGQILQAGIVHKVLNAKKHDEESLIIADAGRYGAVTIATNMAGRGVDIKLGGEMAETLLADVNRVLKQNEVADPYSLANEKRREALLGVPNTTWGDYAASCEAFLQGMNDLLAVKQLGGLHVIGSERHEARRIDNQLRGRAARQGDPGSSQFYLSLEDDLMKRFGGEGVSNLMQRLRIDDSVPIQAGLVNKTIEGSQTRVEGYNFDIRKHLLEYDDVLNTQRNKIYAQRDRIFTKEDLRDDVWEMVEGEVQRRVELVANDEDGRWRLFAWLEEAQPAFQLGEEIYPSYPLKLLLQGLEQTPDKLSALLELARAALRAEGAHLLHVVEKQAETSASRLGDQIRTKKAEAELALEALENEAREQDKDVEPRAAYRAVYEVLGLSKVPPASELEGFNYRDFKKQITGWAESTVANKLRLGLVTTLERRVGVSLNVPREAKSDEDWDTVVEQLQAAVTQAHQTRTERVLGEIERELQSNIPAEPSPELLLRALLNMAISTVVGYDNRTHQRVARRMQRLTYFFVLAEQTRDWETEQLTEEILTHFERTWDGLQTLWGEAQFRQTPELPVENLLPRLQEQFRADAAVAAALAEGAKVLADFKDAARVAAVNIMGHEALTQIHRPLILQVSNNLWIDYLTQVEALRTSIGLEAYAQRDPLVAYKAKAFDLFQELLVNMRAGVVGRAFALFPRQPGEQQSVPARATAKAPAVATPSPVAKPTAAPTGRRLGRNDLCWCGSGKKYKDCHAEKDQRLGAQIAAQLKPAETGPTLTTGPAPAIAPAANPPTADNAEKTAPTGKRRRRH